MEPEETAFSQTPGMPQRHEIVDVIVIRPKSED